MARKLEGAIEMKHIDIGAYNGDSVLHFISYHDIDSIDAYEPNDIYEPLWEAINDFYPEVMFYPYAIWTQNDYVDFDRRVDKHAMGSTMMKNKHGYGMGIETMVRCFDILSILPSNDEKVSLKIDAEGAEYDILERIVKAGKSHQIDRLYVEWHGNKMDGDYAKREEDLTKHFGKRIKFWL
jgi:FkbM family methyltransferase